MSASAPPPSGKLPPRPARPRPHARSRNPEAHRSERVGWLRAAVLGANDGIVSIAGLVVGVAASGAAPGAILASGIAGTARPTAFGRSARSLRTSSAGT